MPDRKTPPAPPTKKPVSLAKTTKTDVPEVRLVEQKVSPPSSPAAQAAIGGVASKTPAAPPTPTPTEPVTGVVMGAALPTVTPRDPKDEITGRQAKTTPTTPKGHVDVQADKDQGLIVGQLLDQCRHPITRVLVGVSRSGS